VPRQTTQLEGKQQPCRGERAVLAAVLAASKWTRRPSGGSSPRAHAGLRWRSTPCRGSSPRTTAAQARRRPPCATTKLTVNPLPLSRRTLHRRYVRVACGGWGKQGVQPTQATPRQMELMEGG
jgi:hypothetical protein